MSHCSQRLRGYPAEHTAACSKEKTYNSFIPVTVMVIFGHNFFDVSGLIER